MFMYGSILIAVTLRPIVLSSKPVDEAVRGEHSMDGCDEIHTNDTLADATDHATRDDNVLGHRAQRRR